MRAVIYTRTSTSSQRTDMQLDALNALVKRSGYELVDTIEDCGVSGTILGSKRDGMKRVMKMVQRREVDVVCVYSVDRIGRKLTDVLSIAEQLTEKGVGLVIHKNGIISSRIADGIASAKAKGVKFGRKPISNDTKQKVIHLREQGMSMNKISKQLSVGNSQVLRICRELTAVAAQVTSVGKEPDC